MGSCRDSAGVAVAPGPCSAGVPVGAFVVETRHTSVLQKALKRHGWLKAGANVTPYAEAAAPEGQLRAVHVSQEGAAAMRGGAEVPAKLAAVLAETQARWMAGLRVRSKACGQALGQRRSEGPSTAFTYSELFAGIGGFRLALDKLGGRSIFASELNVEARQVYAANFGDDPFGDITEIEADEIGQHDILTAGFPCQPFSSLGEQQGFEDPRGLLYQEIIRVLHSCQPRAFILENVSNLIYIEDGSIFERILAELSGEGYDVCWRLINSRVVLPQQRVRLYIVGLRRGGGGTREEPFVWPELPVLERTLAEILEGEDVDEDERYVMTEHQLEKLMASREYQEDPSRRIARLDGRARTLVSSYRSGVRSDLVWRSGAERPRFFTVRECARMQGFPERLQLQSINANRAYHQLGNAVCPVVAAAIAGAVLDAIGGRQPAADAPAEGRRRLVAPSLELLLAACPSPDAVGASGGPSLRAACDSFLLGEAKGPPICTGCGEGLLPGDLEVLRCLLESSEPNAQVCGLFALGRAGYLQNRGCQANADADATAHSGAVAPAVLEADLLPLVVGLLRSSNAEVLRLSVVTVAILSRFSALARALAAEPATLPRLGELVGGGSDLERQASEALRNVEASADR